MSGPLPHAPGAGPVPWRAAPPRTCQWIEGAPGGDDACKCGRAALPGQPWCARHLERVYAPPLPEDCVWRLVFGPGPTPCAVQGVSCPYCRARGRPALTTHRSAP